MFKQMKERVRLEAELAGAKALAEHQVETLREELEVTRDRLESVQAAHDSLTEAHRSLLEVHREQVADLIDRVKKVEAMTIQPVSFEGPVTSLHVPEDEQEAQWQFDQGLIDRGLYNEILEEIGFQNPTVAIDRD
jgi:hypothetical protein